MNSQFVQREHDRLLRELFEFLSIPSVSTAPEHARDCRAAAEWLVKHFRGLGCPVSTLLEGEGHPVVWAESPRVPGAPTLLIYGHYDVQPVDPVKEWVSPPFTPTIRDGRVFARGASDDKGQVYGLIKAYEAILDGDRRAPININFLIEGEEESGGATIAAILEKEPERTKADVVLVADMAYYAPGWPAVYTALRGLCYAEIHVRTLQRDLHSGSYGGAAPNAIETMTRLLSRLKKASGKIEIPKLYRSVERPTNKELKAWRALPFNEEAFMRDEVTASALTGLRKFSVLERVWALPTFEIHGIRGGFTGEGAKTVIPAEATAKVSLRLVPGLGFEKVGKWLTRAVERLAPSHAEVHVKLLHGGDPVEVDVSDPAFALLDRVFETVVGRKSVPVRAGGSIPVIPLLGRSGAPVILTGFGLPDDGLHSPNEKIDLHQLWEGIDVFGRFYESLAKLKAPRKSKGHRAQGTEHRKKARDK
jgi:acetylornithine deacetylase/succinyl-diaminopimelate desuccinylase-like protein